MENKSKLKRCLNALICNLIICFSFGANSQISYYSDCVNGGIVGDGYTAWITGGLSSIDLPMPNGSTVKKAIFFSNLYKWQGNNIPASDKIVSINGIELTLSESYSLNNEIFIPLTQLFVSTIAIDITNIINSSISTYSIDPFTNQSPVVSPLFSDFYILVIFENPSSSNVCFDILLNSQFSTSSLTYEPELHNHIDMSNHVGLAIHSSGVCNIEGDRYDVFVNNNFIGSIGGQEDNTEINCAGVIGSFQYYNGSLIGIGNDIGNEIVNGLDAIANIQSYIDNFSPSIIRFDYGNPPAPNSNKINQLFLTYSSPCLPFETTLLTSDTLTCTNTPLQLSASGGIAYNWLPQTNLSCYDCPNPIFIGDSTINYTVRIWASDSCSKVLPVRVRVSSCASLEELGSAFEIFAPTLVNGDLGGVYQIQMKNVLQYQYELYTLDGKVVYQKSGFSESATLDLWDKALMESGLYLYRIWVRDEVGNQEVSGGKVVVVR